MPEEQRGQCLPGITEVYSYISAYYTIGWGPQLPEVLISVIFAAVFIGVEVPPVKAIWEGSGPQIMYGQVVTHGLWFWGLLAGWAFGTMFLYLQIFVYLLSFCNELNLVFSRDETDSIIHSRRLTQNHPARKSKINQFEPNSKILRIKISAGSVASCSCLEADTDG